MSRGSLWNFSSPVLSGALGVHFDHISVAVQTDLQCRTTGADRTTHINSPYIRQLFRHEK